MADLRGFREELVRQITKRIPAPFMAGTVADDPDTWAHTVPVQVGIELVVADYRGRVPVVGEEVWVQRQGAGYKLITQVPRAGISGGVGSPLTPPVAGLNTAFIKECWLWGHSFLGGDTGRVDGYGWDDEVGHPFALEDYFFGALGISWPDARLTAQSGQQLYAFVGNVLMNYGYGVDPAEGLIHPYNQGVGPYPSRHGCHGIILGTNDLNGQGDPAAEGGRALTQWRHGVRAMTAWLRLGAYFAPYLLYNAGAPEGGTDVASKYAGCTYGGGWTRTPAAGALKTTANGGLDIFSNTFYPADGYMKTTTTGSSFTVRVPADHPGTTVWLFFIGEIGATGATGASVTWTGGSATLVTNDIVRNPQIPVGILPNYAMVAVPVPLTRTGAAQTITVNAGTLAGGHQLRFCGWGLEAPDPKLIAWGSIPLQVGGNGAYVAAYDAATLVVTAEFIPTGSVVVADLSAFSGLATPYLFRDATHPNREGNRVLAHSLLAGMNLVALPVTNLASTPTDANLRDMAMAVPA